MSVTSVLEHTEDGVSTIVLNRIEKHNAFDDIMIRKLTQAIRKAIDDPLINIIVLKSAGSHFCAGADLNWMSSLKNATLEENIEDAKALAQLMSILYHSPKPTLAQVQGNVFGGGVGLVAASHIAIAAQDARFCFSEAKLGLIPAVISPYVINAMGNRLARFYFLTAQVFDASTALKLNLCHEVVSNADLELRSNKIIEVLKHNGPKALREINMYLNQFDAIKISAELIDMTSEKIGKLRCSSEGQEGMQAFLEKRKPNWIK